MKRTVIISILLVILLLLSTSCASGVSQEEYDRVKKELSAIQGELASIQSELTGKLTESMTLQVQNEELNKKLDTVQSEYEVMQTKYEEFIAEYDELSGDYDNVQSEYEAIQDKYDELSAEYEDLTKQREVAEEEEIIEEDIEQALFELVNQERTSNGLDELEWGHNLYKTARANSANMEKSKVLENANYPSNWQEVYWTTGYNTADEMAEAILMIWENKQRYNSHFLNSSVRYAAIGVYKSEGIFYITYIADAFP